PTAPARSTLHRHLGRVGEACHQADERQRQEVFTAGKVPAGKRKVPVLMIEADGKWVRLQRTPDRKSLEVKLAVAYEGWEREGLERWRLRDKQVYVSTGDAVEVWEGLSARLAQHYDLSGTRVATAGDAAAWVKQGREHFQGAVWAPPRATSTRCSPPAWASGAWPGLRPAPGAWARCWRPAATMSWSAT